MKLQIDTNAKTIRLEESVNLGELHGMFEKLFPNGAWKEFKLETTVLTSWVNPVVIDRYPYQPFTYPWNQPYYSTGDTLTANNGVYNVVLN